MFMYTINMVSRYPVEYKLTPEKIDKGTHWLTLSLKNIGTKTLKNIDVKLNPVDSYAIHVLGTGKYLENLKATETEVIPFQVIAKTTGKLFATLEGRDENQDYFYFESPEMNLKVGLEAAELVSLFALTHPYCPLGEHIEVEARIKGLEKSRGLTLEFWAKTPSGRYEDLARIETKDLDPGEEATYTAMITPSETGMHTITAYLKDGYRRIGKSTEYVWAKKP